MKTEFGGGVLHRICCALSDLGKSGYWRFLFYPLLTSAPVLFIAPVVKNAETWNADKAIPEWVRILSSYIAENPFVSYAIAFVFVALIRTVGYYVSKYSVAEHSLNREDIIYLIKAANGVIHAKSQRFGDKVKELKGATASAEQIFLSITRPMEQIRLNAIAIHSVLVHIDDRYRKGQANLKLGLLKIKNGGPIDWIEYVGGNPSVSADALNHEDSTVLHCIRSKKPIIINNIARESQKPKGVRRFHPANPSGENVGSLLCYPVKYLPTNEVPYVVVLRTTEKNYFKPEDLFKWAVDGFVERMQLEHSLTILFDKAQNHREAMDRHDK